MIPSMPDLYSTTNVNRSYIPKFKAPDDIHNIIKEIDNEQNNSNYEEKVQEQVNQKLSYLGCTPSVASIGIFDKTYTEGDFNCTKRQNYNGTTTIIKEEKFDLLKVLGNSITNQSSEKIIEEYDSKGNITKSTYYKKDSSYCVSKYNNDGSISMKTEVKNTQTADGYKSRIDITHYNQNGTYYVTTVTYELNDSCEDGEIITKSSTTYYDKNGNVDILTSLLGICLEAGVETFIDTMT